MQGDNFIHLPGWVKLTAMVVLTATLLASIGVTYMSIGAGGSEPILISMTLAQTCASGLALALILFYSQKSISIENLIRKSDRFLESDLVGGLRRLESVSEGPLGRMADVSVRVSHASGSYGAMYRGSIDGLEFLFRVNLRMGNALAIFLLPHSEVGGAEGAREKIGSTINRAEQLGFKVDLLEERQEFDGKDYVCFYVLKDLESGFLFNTESRLGLTQQLTLIFRSVCITARRGGWKLVHHDA